MTSKAGFHQHGQHKVQIADDGQILVKSGDWLSKYSAAIYRGNVSHVSEYGRLKVTGMVPIVGNQIFAGETIYHVPTYNDFKGRGSRTGRQPTSNPLIQDPWKQARQTLLHGARSSLEMVVLPRLELDQKFHDIVKGITGKAPKELKKTLAATDRAADVTAVLISALNCGIALDDGKVNEAIAHGLITIGGAWSCLATDRKATYTRRLREGFMRSKQLRPFGMMIGTVDEIGGMGDLMKIAACFLITGDERKEMFFEGARDLLKKAKDDPAKSAPLLVPLTEFLLQFVPKKLAMRMGGKKVPIVGTILVGIVDIADICSTPGDGAAWLSLGSTVAGAFPGVGTAVSAFIDIGLLLNDVAKAFNELSSPETGLFSKHDVGI